MSKKQEAHIKRYDIQNKLSAYQVSFYEILVSMKQEKSPWILIK